VLILGKRFHKRGLSPVKRLFLLLWLGKQVCGRSRRIHPEKEPREEELGRRGKEGKDEPKNGRTRDRRANKDEERGDGFQTFSSKCPYRCVIFF